HFEYVAPTARMRDAGPPGTVHVGAGARALAGEGVRAGHDPVEGRVVVQDALQQRAEIREQLADLRFAGGEAPLGEEHLRVVGEQIEDAAACGGYAFVVKRLQILEGDGFAL